MRRIIAICLSCLFSQGLAFSATISEAKLLGDGAGVVLPQKTVTHIGSAFLYVQEATGGGAIRVEATSSGVSVGSRVDLVGIVGTNDQGERVIVPQETTAAGSGIVKPVFMRNTSLGGGDWNYLPSTGAGQRGISGAFGANNIGTLIRVQGKIIQGAPGDTGPVVIDDGSGVHVQIILPSGVQSPGYGAVIAATGVLTMQKEHQQVTGPTNPTFRDFFRRLILAQAVHVLTTGPEWRYTGDMVYVPAGSFMSGNNGIEDYHDQNGLPLTWEFPQHTVYMSGYWIGKYEVTRGEYRQFMDAGGYSNPVYWSKNGWQWKTSTQATQPLYWNTAPWNASDLHPVIGVAYYECEAFCNWAGGHMTTKAQWEKAARWTGTHSNTYPWGDGWDPEKCNNYDDSRYPGLETAPVGSYPAGVSPYGCHDMAGNVWERCYDWFGAHYFERTPVGGWLDPQGPADGSDYFYDPANINRRVVCGGAAGNYDGDIWCRCAYTMQDWPEYRQHFAVGFRIAR